jgi:hypothetical protein
MPSPTRWARSLASDQVENAVIPQSAGDVRAIVQIQVATIARRSRTGLFALREIRASLRPSSIDRSRTKTLGRRASLTSRT